MLPADDVPHGCMSSPLLAPMRGSGTDDHPVGVDGSAASCGVPGTRHEQGAVWMMVFFWNEQGRVGERVSIWQTPHGCMSVGVSRFTTWGRSWMMVFG